jgi:hypothetical protein
MSEMLPSRRSNGNVAIMALDKGKTVNMNDLHKLLTLLEKTALERWQNFMDGKYMALWSHATTEQLPKHARRT